MPLLAPFAGCSRSRSLALAASAAMLALGCSRDGREGSAAGESRAPTILHLADELSRARVECASAPAASAELAWDFTTPQPAWKLLDEERFQGLARVGREESAQGLRLSIGPPKRGGFGFLVGGIGIELPEGSGDAWASMLVRLRSSARLGGISAGVNVDSRRGLPQGFGYLSGDDRSVPVFNDGSAQSYLLPLRLAEGVEPRSIAFFAAAPEPASFELLSIALVPRSASFPARAGLCSLTREGVTRRTLYAHAPARLAWRLRVPEGGRCDLGLTVQSGESLRYRASVATEDGHSAELLDETVGDAGRWEQRSLDLRAWAGREVELVLEASSEREGAVAFLGAPVLSGSAPSELPNVVFYVIDGGGADLMSVYGYERATTPFLEELAREGVLFEHAHSNSTWTQPSTASFMTSLQHSVLGGLRRGVHSTPIPHGATTMAEHMRRGGYQTASFTTNPNAARVIGLERGVDVLRDLGSRHHSTSSADLHEHFWSWRAAYPGAPYWVHFQTTDVHEPNEPVEPFAGRWVSAGERTWLGAAESRLFAAAGSLFGKTGIQDFYDRAIEASKVDRKRFFAGRRGLYDETMCHQDEELRRFVARLKESGEWERTLLVIGSDHGHPAGTFARFGRGELDPQPEPWQGALFDSYSTRVPLLFVWPGKIRAGLRVAQPVSMIDVLPTLLDLVGLPPPEVAQGRSLAPFLRGGELEARPVILDEFRVDEETGELVGNIELIDGRFGASLEIGPRTSPGDPARGRHAVPAGGRWGAVHPFYDEAPRLLLYDLVADPLATRAVNDAHPELVARYEKLLLEHWRAHRALAERFGDSGERALDPEMLEQLRALGYVR